MFFGRTAQIGEIITSFQTQELEAQTNTETPPKHFILILGSSGSGKSSLARAGVLPMLTKPGVIEGANSWRKAIFKPGDTPSDPILAMVESLADENALPELFADRHHAPRDRGSHPHPATGRGHASAPGSDAGRSARSRC